MGDCDVTPNGIYDSIKYNKSFTVGDGGIIVSNTGDTGVVTPPDGTPPIELGPISTYWGGTGRTVNDRGLIKDKRFTEAQYQLNSSGAIINTNIHISVQKLREGYLHDNNWNNMKGHSYKRWKIAQEFEFNTSPLTNQYIPPIWTGKQIAVTVYYFNSSGIIQEQYQEFIQL
jgi:hypothetical protein